MVKPTRDLKVVDVVRHQSGKVVDLYIEKPADMEFNPSDGVGIPASFNETEFKKLKGLLTGCQDAELLLPHEGMPGPDFASPSIAFLENLIDRAIAYLEDKSDACPYHSGIRRNLKRLEQIVEDPDLTEILQANYSVIDILQLFPRILYAQDIINHQPQEKGGKTYTVDGRSCVKRDGVDCFRLNITQDDGPAYRALFDERTPAGSKPGQSSSYLRSLKKGDVVKINAAVKPGPQIPDVLSDERAVILVAQGNAMIRLLSILEDIKERKQNGEVFGPVYVLGAFKHKDEVLEVEALKPYLDDATLSELHLCLSRDSESEQYDHSLIQIHHEKRVPELFQEPPFNGLGKPFILIGGGHDFAISVGKIAAELHGYDFENVLENKKDHSDMRISKSPNRRATLQGEHYERPNYLFDKNDVANGKSSEASKNRHAPSMK